MAIQSGISLVLGIEHLDSASQELIDRPERDWPGPPAAAASVNASLVRLLGAELRVDPDAIDRAA